MPKWMMPDKVFIKEIMMKIKFIFSEPRWCIIKIIGNSIKGTNEIYNEIQRSYIIPKTTLYYHLSMLEEAGIIEMAGYHEEGGGAPEKTWKLKIKKIEIDIINGKINT